MAELSVAACERIIRDATGLRVGNDAARYLSEFLEEVGEDISRESGNMARHAKRKTVKTEDIKLVVRER